ncbi:MAG: signal peptidase II [Deltaproteobacteria bacterium]|nr:signal peptidase II [Deltaproteobacteria bacterium]MBN2670430.1 signal peptidase II [Deltaproteobacteria bacterium]
MTWRNKPILSVLLIVIAGIAVDAGSKIWAQKTLLSDRFHQREGDYPVCGNETEEMARSHFVRVNASPITVIPNVFRFRYVENCASSFNLMTTVSESFRFPFFMIISVLACILIPLMFLKTPDKSTYMLFALPFILAGALGNLIDRMVYRYVVDFVDWYVVFGGKEYHWPTFNIADALIVIGIALMVLQLKKDSMTSSSKTVSTPSVDPLNDAATAVSPLPETKEND